MADEHTQVTDQTQETKPTETKAPERSLVNEGAAETKVEDKAAETKTEDKKVETPSVNLAELKLPEGFKLEEAQGKAFTELLSRPDLSPQARAQELVNLHAAEVKKVTDQIGTQWTQTVDEWHKGIAADKDLGTGDPKNPLKTEVKASIAKILDSYGGTELRQALDLTGAGSNPAIIRALHKISQKLTEGGAVAGSPPTKKVSGPGAAALYPDNPEG